MRNLLKNLCSHKRDLQKRSQDLFKDEDYDFIMDFPKRSIDTQNRKKLLSKNIEIRSLALFISFRKDAICECELDDDQFHIFGFHPIFRDFSKRSRSSKTRAATEFVQECALNCWANGWNIVVLVYSNSRFCEDITKFIKEIRRVCDNLTLDIIIIQPKNNENNNENKENNDYIKHFHTNAGPTALIFQAQKFEKGCWLQEKIRLAWSARGAFMIGRNNESSKRKDWESPKPPNGEIFKEVVMKKAILEKFSQHKYLRYKLLSTSNASLIEHTDNDSYWGDGEVLNKFG
ncbi:1223_t:CDS:2 [Dentiscutata erythropus]|uniref:1223_t:CDS:1 n=1 Tax=Dentiscutata erythropus TaxID=1348616 RepID=A0A9N8ZHV3_9GLOM|nr:1223_t:CDS:2 [Dentiscutata erythropus]